MCVRQGWASCGRRAQKRCAVGPSTAPGVRGRPGHRAADALLGPSCSKDQSHLTSTAVTGSGSLCHGPVMRVNGKLWFISMEPEAL